VAATGAGPLLPAAAAEEVGEPGGAAPAQAAYVEDETPHVRAFYEARQSVAKAFLAVRRRLEVQIAALRGESLEESLFNLSEGTSYIWPGPGGRFTDMGVEAALPAPPFAGLADIDFVLSNRRFLKVLEEVSALREEEAGALISAGIEEGLPQYLSLYEAYMDHLRTIDPDNWKQPSHGIGFRVTNYEDGSPTIIGARLRLFALLATAGSVPVSTAAPAVLAACREAVAQRQYFYGAEDLNLITRSVMLQTGCLYSRPVLGMALLGACMEPAEAEELAQALEIKWETSTVTTYDAAATPFDHPARDGLLPVDYSLGAFPITYPSELNDAQFDAIMAAAEASVQQGFRR
jgi:hypothetical protein